MEGDPLFRPAFYFDHDCSSITFPSGSVTSTHVTFDPVAVVSVFAPGIMHALRLRFPRLLEGVDA
jgi:hypothetical protein